MSSGYEQFGAYSGELFKAMHDTGTRVLQDGMAVAHTAGVEADKLLFDNLGGRLAEVIANAAGNEMPTSLSWEPTVGAASAACCSIARCRMPRPKAIASSFWSATNPITAALASRPFRRGGRLCRARSITGASWSWNWSRARSKASPVT